MACKVVVLLTLGAQCWNAMSVHHQAKLDAMFGNTFGLWLIDVADMKPTEMEYSWLEDMA